MADCGAANGVVRDVTTELSWAASRRGARLRQGGYQGTVQDIERFARNRPGAFLFGALAAGLVVGRVAKSSDTQAIADAAKSGQDGESGSPGHW